MAIIFPNLRIQRIYRYIQLNDGQNILYKDIESALNLSAPTVRKWIRWLLKRELIFKDGKRISIAELS